MCLHLGKNYVSHVFSLIVMHQKGNLLLFLPATKPTGLVEINFSFFWSLIDGSQVESLELRLRRGISKYDIAPHFAQCLPVVGPAAGWRRGGIWGQGKGEILKISKLEYLKK